MELLAEVDRRTGQLRCHGPVLNGRKRKGKMGTDLYFGGVTVVAGHDTKARSDVVATACLHDHVHISNLI